MQQLHLVGLTTDLDSIICSARKGAKSGSFVLPLNEHLLQVIAEAVSRRNADGVEIEVPEALQPPSAAAPRRQSHLSPREIQDRLRAGRSLEEIAAEAGVGEEWVARFAAPVEAERSQVVGRARRLTYYRPRHGDSGEALGMAVRWNLADRGVRLANDEFDAAWSAYQLADSAWMVTFQYEARKREHEAEWEVDLATNELLSRNRLATELGYVEPGRRRRAMTSLQPVASSSAVRAHAQTVATSGAGDAADGEGDVRSASAKKKTTSGARSTKAAAAAKKRPATAAAKRSAAATKRSTASSGTAAKRPVATKRAAASTRPAAKRSAAAAKRTTASKASARTTKSAAKRPATGAARVTKKATTARRAPAKKAATRSTTRRTGRGVPPGQSTPAPVAVVDDRPVPNELGRRRLQLATGSGPSRPAARSGSGGRPAASMPGVRIAAARSGDVAAAQRDARRPERTVRPTTTTSSPPPRDEIDAPEPGLDVGDSEAAAEARRAERRRARAAARTTPSPPRSTAAGGGEDDDGRVVTIRANRASPPRGEAELVLPADRPPLRPAQPATQPRKRLFNRNGR